MAGGSISMMRLQLKSVVVGMLLGGVALTAMAAAFLYVGTDHRLTYHEQLLPSGQKLRVVSTMLVWGVEHGERVRDDAFQLEYLASDADLDQSAKDRETLEAFELIRPMTELWGFRD